MQLPVRRLARFALKAITFKSKIKHNNTPLPLVVEGYFLIDDRQINKYSKERDVNMYSKAVVPDNPSKRVFGWYAKYYRGSIIDEFNDDGSDNDFRDIQKDLVKEFGLYGGGTNLWMETHDGVFHITSKKGSHAIRLYLEDEVESIIKLTDRDDIIYSDIIQYKGFYTYASAPTGKEENKDKPLNGDMVTSKYIFGYKTTFEVNGGKLNFTARIIVDLEAKNITLALTFTPSFNFKGHLRCRFNDNPVDGTITLEAGKKKEVGMIVSTF